MPTLDLCPACGSSRSETAAALDETRRGRFLEYSRVKYGGLLDTMLDGRPPVVDRCSDCGHCWYRHQPEPEQLSAMYAAGRPLTAGVVPQREPTTAMLREMTRLRCLVRSLGDAGTLLDFGSGYGRWARAASSVGFRVTAFEPSAERGAETDAHFELVHDLTRLHGRRFSAVQLEQVLEHVADPLDVLKRVRKFCGAATVVRVTVPNLLRAPEGRAIWTAWPFDGRSTHTMAPYEHLHGFTPASLDRLLGRAGFQPIGLTALIRHYPSVPLRGLLGMAVPSMGTTLRLVLPARGTS